MRGKRENFFSREKKPNVGFVILVPLSRHSLGDGGSHPFKKSGKTFLFTLTYLCREQLLTKKAAAGAAGKDFPQEVAFSPLSGLVELLLIYPSFYYLQVDNEKKLRYISFV